MTEYDLLIINGVVVTDSETKECDVAVKDEKIVAIEPRGSFAGAKATKSIDAEGGYVMVGPDRFSTRHKTYLTVLEPGGVDSHVHLQEPPLFGKGSTADNYETGMFTSHEHGAYH